MINKTTPGFPLEALKSGERKEFARFVDTCSSPIYRMALKMLGDQQDAEDVLQNTFFRRPNRQAYYQAHAAQVFIIIGIEAGESADEVASFVKQYQLTFPIWLDPQRMGLEAFNNYNLPSLYVIDRDGVVHLAWSGVISREMLEKYVTPMVVPKAYPGEVMSEEERVMGEEERWTQE